MLHSFPPPKAFSLSVVGVGEEAAVLSPLTFLAPRCVFGTCQVFAFSCLGHSWSLRTLLDLVAQLGLCPRRMKINGDSYDVM